jgi:DNA-binding transcriptional MerR regulator
MQWTIPGTVLQIPRQDAQRIDEVFSSMFLAGDLLLGQVAGISGLEPYTVQNWVKRGLLSPPQRKRYTQRQLCRILNINMLKGVLPMERICGMLSYINGHLDDESDDIIDDSQLYFMFVRLAARARELQHRKDREDLLEIYLADYEEPVPGAKERVRAVLNIMLTAWLAARMQQLAENLLDELNYETVKENENGTERNLPLVTP